MEKLQYNPANLNYEVVSPQLSDEQKLKVCLIEDYNKMHRLLTGHNISDKQFDILWDGTLDGIKSSVYSIELEVAFGAIMRAANGDSC